MMTKSNEQEGSRIGLLQRIAVANGGVFVDQVLVSASNFGVTVWAARALGLPGFGRFTIIWMAVLFINSLHMAAIVMPMFTIIGQIAESDVAAYGSVALTLQRLFNVTVTALLTGALGLVWLSNTLSVADVASVMVLSATYHAQEFHRRYQFAVDRPGRALTIDAVAYIGRFPGLAILAISGRTVTVTSIVLAISAGYAAAVIASFFLGARFPKPTRPSMSAYGSMQWSLARHLLPSALMQWTSVNLHVVAAGPILGAGAVGVARLGQSLLNAGNVVLLALENVVPLRLARIGSREGSRQAVRATARLTLAGLGALSLPLAAVCLFAEPIMAIVFGAEHSAQGWVLYWFAAIYAISLVSVMIRALARAIGHLKSWTTGYVVSSAASLILVYPLQEAAGVTGIMLGMLLSYVALVSVASWMLTRNGGRRAIH